MSDNFKIDPEIQGLLTPHTKEELETLEALIGEGLHVEPGVVAILGTDRILADGHTRHNICTRLGITFPTRDKRFKDREAMIDWIIRNQLGRRNLTPERKTYYIGKEYLNIKKPKGITLHQNDGMGAPAGESAQNVGEHHGVSQATVERAATFAEAVEKLPTEQKKAVLDGKSKLSKTQIAAGQAPFCPRCARHLRVGQPLPTGCPECKQLAGEKPPKVEKQPPPDKPAKPGKPRYAEKAFEKAYGALVREVDKRGNLMGKGKCFAKIHDLLGTVLEEFKKWKQGK